MPNYEHPSTGGKSICFFGTFNPEYARNKVLSMGLIHCGYNVIYCTTEKKGILKYFDLYKKLLNCKKKADYILIPFPGKIPLLIAKLSCRKKVILDSLVSLYDSNVFDRQVIKKYSLMALSFWFLDFVSCRMADVIICDTEEHIRYFVKTFFVKRDKFIRIFVGSDESDFFYDSDEISKEDLFLVHFHGTFIPLQGIEFIIEAAKKLENEKIQFNIIGRGQTYEFIVDNAKKYNLKNVNFIDPVPYKILKKYISKAAVSLGVFGKTNKAKRVIPNKVYEALSVGIPIITGDSMAIREILTDNENVILVNMCDGNDLADKILMLKNDNELRKKIGQNGLTLFKKNLVPEKIVRDLVTLLMK